MASNICPGSAGLSLRQNAQNKPHIFMRDIAIILLFFYYIYVIINLYNYIIKSSLGVK